MKSYSSVFLSLAEEKKKNVKKSAPRRNKKKKKKEWARRGAWTNKRSLPDQLVAVKISISLTSRSRPPFHPTIVFLWRRYYRTHRVFLFFFFSSLRYAVLRFHLLRKIPFHSQVIYKTQRKIKKKKKTFLAQAYSHKLFVQRSLCWK